MGFSVLIARDEEFSSQLNNRATFLGFTALHYAVLTDNIEVVKVLLKAGANPLIENDSGHRPVQYAKEGEIKQMLQEYGDKVSCLLFVISSFSSCKYIKHLVKISAIILSKISV